MSSNWYILIFSQLFSIGSLTFSIDIFNPKNNAKPLKQKYNNNNKFENQNVIDSESLIYAIYI